MRKTWKMLGKRILAVALATAVCISTDAGSFLLGTDRTVKEAEAAAPVALTDAEVNSIYSQYFEDKTYDRVSVHDPSIVVGYYEGEYTSSSTVYGTQNAGNTRKQIYFVFGSHMAWAYSFDLKNWKTFENNINRDYATIFASQGDWSKRGDKVYNISGNLWAPDVFWDASYNNGAGAWLMYMSINGCSWNSSISLLTSDTLNGNWTYVDTIVYSGFNADGTYDYAATNYKAVTGETSLPDRFKVDKAYTCKDDKTNCTATNWNTHYGAHAIDPCVIEDGDKLWMTYGSWSGGIWMIELDKSTGLRKGDFKPAYEANVSDPYMGYMLAGGNGVSGEASYIQKIGNKYYLFISYGGLVATGGYNMRVFSADAITGPYTDIAGHDARYSTSNKGAGTIDGSVGNRLMAYYKWSFMDNGFTAEGHNSAFVDNDGKAYVIYHTRFDDGTEGHQMRVHQLFQAKNGGLVTAPFEYSDESLAASAYQADEVTGTYKVVTMKSSAADHTNLRCATEQTIQLNADGSVTGDYTGTWTQAADGPYVTLTSGNITYQGVFLKQNIEETAYETMCLTLVGNNDISIWGYQPFSGDVAIAKAAHDMRVSIGTMTSANLSLPTDIAEGVEAVWSSSDPDIIAPDGTVTAPEQNKDVTLTVTLTSSGYSYSKDYTTMVVANLDNADMETGMKALYNFNDGMTNVLNKSQAGVLLNQASGTIPRREYNAARGSKVLHQYFGYDGASSISYAKYPNPLKGETLTGATISLWVNCVDSVDTYDAIWSFLDGDNSDGIDGRLYLTPNVYLGYNGTGGWFDLNHADTATNTLAINEWKLVTVTITDSTVGIYVNGALTYTYDKYVAFNKSGDYDRSYVLKMISSAADFYTGFGSFWGSAPVCMDNIRIYNRALNDTDVLKLYVEELKEMEEDVASNIVDTSGYYYYNDYNDAVNTNEWASANASDSLSIEVDTEAEYIKYIKFNPAVNPAHNTRSAYTAFSGLQAMPDHYTIEFDAQLTAGNQDPTQLALATGAYSRANAVLESGYIWDLRATNSTQWTVSNGDKVTIPKGRWIHMRTDISQTDKTAKLTITGNGVSYEGTITGLSATQVQGIFWLSGRYQGVGCFDNMRIFAYEVAFDANGGIGTMTNQVFKQDTAAKLKKNLFTKEGYVFAGWATSADGDSLYSDEKSVSNLTTAGGTVTLYAKWVDPSTITPEPTTEPDPSEEPGTDPTTKPDASEKPGTDPTTKPNASEEPGTNPTTKPGTSEKPGTDPTTKPGTSEKPGTDPTTKPDASTKPSSNPSTSPSASVSAAPPAPKPPVPSSTVRPTTTASPAATGTPIPTATAPASTDTPTPIPTAGTTTVVVTDDKAGTTTEIITNVSDNKTTIQQTITADSSDASLIMQTEKDSSNTVSSASAAVYTGSTDSSTSNQTVVNLPPAYLEAMANEKIDTFDIYIEKITVDEAKQMDAAVTSVKLVIPDTEGVSVGKIRLTGEAVQSAKQTGSKLQIEVDCGEHSCTVTIPASQMKNLNEKTDITIITKTLDETGTLEQENIQKVLSNNKATDENTYIVSTAENDTKIGMKAESIVITSAKPGDTLYVYRYNEKTGKLEEIANCKKTVSASGTVTAHIYSGSDYVVTNKKLSGSNVKTLLSEVKANVKNKKVSKGKTTTMNVSLGSTLVKKSDFKQSVAFAKQAAKVSYSSSNKKVAVITQNGKIKAKKKGTATVTVTVKLKDGSTKKIKKKITVK